MGGFRSPSTLKLTHFYAFLAYFYAFLTHVYAFLAYFYTFLTHFYDFLAYFYAFLAAILYLSGVGTSLSNIAFSGFDSSSTESKPVTCCD